jgi:hypothetical protein
MEEKLMRTFAVSVALAAAIVLSGCGATRRVASTVAPGPALTAATITFVDRDHGKDAGSAVDVWLLHGSDEMAHLHSVGTKFDDHASIVPMQLSLSGAFHQTDLANGQLRIRLTPDGNDDWSFDPRLTLSFSDGTSRSYMWPTVMLDNRNPERTLSFSSAAQVP